MAESWTWGDIREGADVYGSDGEKVGSIVSVRSNYIVVEKGFFFPTDYYIPVSAVSTIEDGRVYLNVSKDAALNQGWDAMPADLDADVATTGAYDTATTGTATLGTAAAGVGGAIAGAADRVGDALGVGERDGTWTDTGMAAARATGETRLEAGERIAVPVHEEELIATKRAQEVGEVQVEKVVTAEEKVLEVPVTEERVRVERRVVDRPVTDADATAFQEGVIEVPVYGEEVDVQRRVRVAEEVEIGKEAVQRTERVADTVRREDVRIVGDTVQTDTTVRSDAGIVGDETDETGYGATGRTEGGAAAL